jgi:hypothetical protein
LAHSKLASDLNACAEDVSPAAAQTRANMNVFIHMLDRLEWFLPQDLLFITFLSLPARPLAKT